MGDWAEGLQSDGVLDDLAKLCRDPQLVGISLTSNLVSQCIQLISTLIAGLLHLPDILGEVRRSQMPLESPRHADSICIRKGGIPSAEVAIGEGEETIVELTRILGTCGPDTQESSKASGIGFKENSEADLAETRSFSRDLDSVHPAWNHLGIEEYFFSGDYFYSGLGGAKLAAHSAGRSYPWCCR